MLGALCLDSIEAGHLTEIVSQESVFFSVQSELGHLAIVDVTIDILESVLPRIYPSTLSSFGSEYQSAPIDLSEWTLNEESLASEQTWLRAVMDHKVAHGFLEL